MLHRLLISMVLTIFIHGSCVALEYNTKSHWPSASMQEVHRTLSRWAKAWSNQDVETYLSFYDDGFQVPAGYSRKSWEEKRYKRIMAPAFIKVSFLIEIMEVRKGTQARVHLIQKYKTKNYRDKTTKEILLKKRNGKWYIIKETKCDILE